MFVKPTLSHECDLSLMGNHHDTSLLYNEFTIAYSGSYYNTPTLYVPCSLWITVARSLFYCESLTGSTALMNFLLVAHDNLTKGREEVSCFVYVDLFW